MNDQSVAAEFSRFVPEVLKHRLAAGAAPRIDGVEMLEVAALWLDISGFTSLTSRFARQGPRGAEVVGDMLDRVYSALIDRIAAAGGDVVDFAGDGVLAVWTAQHASLTAATRRAAQCALTIQRDMDHFEVGEADIRFYAGVGAGNVTLLDVGGADGRWRFLVAGPPLAQIALASQACAAGEVVVSREAHALLGAHAYDALPRPNETFAIAPSGPAGAMPPDPTMREADPPETVTAAIRPTADRLRPYLVESVARRVDAGQTGWLAEFRLTSILFVIVPEVDVSDQAGCDAVRAAVRLAQERVSGLGGSLNQVLMDDTGLVLLAAWGVPDRTHEDDSRRAMLAASEIHSALAAAGFPAGAGVATGRVFCGAVGNATRSRYALIGEAVNRAARIAKVSMASARCDGNTRERSERWLALAAAGTVTLKGIAEPVALFSLPAAHETADAGRPATGSADPQATPVHGREREREVLEAALRDAGSSSGRPLLLLEGEAGIGKSVLLNAFGAAAGASGWQVFTGGADAIEQRTAYYPWREPFRVLLGIDETWATSDARRHVLQRLGALPGIDDRIALLEPVLGLGFEESAITAAMSGRDRGPAARELLARAFDELAGSETLLLLEDLHWFDSASLELIGRIRSRVPRLLVAATTRPPRDDAAPQLVDLAADAGTVRIPLMEMNGADVLSMVEAGLGVDGIPEALARFLVDRGEGHPLFTMELALLLRELGIVQVQRRQCRFDADDPRLAGLTFPEKAESVVASRIDQLDPSHQLALKVAAVIGRSFEHQLLHDVYPIASEKSALHRILEALTLPQLIEEEQQDPVLAYLFRHVVIREVAYGLVSFAQRRQLHADVARSLEAQPESEISSNLPLLAHHWQMAEEPEPAIHYLRRAGEQALHGGAAREALGFFQTALAIAEREQDRIEAATPQRIADLEYLCGEACEQLLDLAESTRWLSRAIERLGYQVPAAGAGRRRALLSHSLRQLGHILWPSALRRRPTAQQAETFELAASAYSLMAEHRYFESDLMGMVLLSLMAVNFAERGRSPNAAERSYLTLTQTVGLMGMTPLVRRYSALSANSTQGRNQSFREIELGGRLLAAGRLEEASAAGARAAELAQRYADPHHEAQGWGIVVSAELRRGNADRGIAAAERMIPTGHLDWSYTAQATAAAISGRPEHAIERLARMEEWEPAFALGHLTIRVLWAEDQGDLAGADRAAAEALAAVEAPGLKNAFTAGHYANLLAYYSRRYHGLPAADVRGRAAVAADVRRLHLALRRFCRLFPIGRPRLEQAAALLALHEGRNGRGIRHLRRGLQLAETFGMRPELVALYLELARWKLPDAPDALARARRLCAETRLDRLLREVETVGS